MDHQEKKPMHEQMHEKKAGKETHHPKHGKGEKCMQEGHHEEHKEKHEHHQKDSK